MKYFLEHILAIGFQFWEPPRGALHKSNFDFLSLSPLLNPLLDRQANGYKPSQTTGFMFARGTGHLFASIPALPLHLACTSLASDSPRQ